MSAAPIIDAWEAIVAERARCAALCNMMADHLDQKAEEIRAKGAFMVRSFWPPFRQHAVVRPGYERQAETHNQAAGIFRNLVKPIQEGWLPEDTLIGRSPPEQMPQTASEIAEAMKGMS